MTVKRKPMQLAQVADARGRVDVAAYRIVERLMERIEQERGLVGVRENLLPLIEAAITRSLPRENLLKTVPPELRAILTVIGQNRGRL